jgi:hypothetical protein
MTTVWNNKSKSEAFSMNTNTNKLLPALVPVNVPVGVSSPIGRAENKVPLAPSQAPKVPLVSQAPLVPLEPFDSDEGLNEDEIDNIKDFGTPAEAPDVDIANPEDKAVESEPNIDKDISAIQRILQSLVTILLTVHITFVWYRNLTQGTSEAAFYKNLEFVDKFSFITEYFYNIVKFIDIFLIEKLSNYSKLLIDNTFLKDRTLFFAIFAVSATIANYLIDFIKVLYAQISNKKFDIRKLPGPTTLFTVLYFGFVVYGLIDLFSKGGAVSQFMVANPIYALIVVIIRVSMLYVFTLGGLPFVFFIYISYYSIVGTTIDPNSLYAQIKDSFGFYKSIYSIVNLKHVFFELQEDSPVKNMFERGLRWIFGKLVYVLLLAGLIPAFKTALKLHTPTIKAAFIGILLLVVGGIAKYAIDDDAELLIALKKLVSS